MPIYSVDAIVAGEWIARITGYDLVTSTEEYEINVSAVTNITLELGFDDVFYAPGNPIIIMATLLESGNPIATIPSIPVTYNNPGGTGEIILYDDGNTPDVLAGDGIYTQEFTDTGEEGTYQFAANISGSTPVSGAFVRQASNATVVTTNQNGLPIYLNISSQDVTVCDPCDGSLTMEIDSRLDGFPNLFDINNTPFTLYFEKDGVPDSITDLTLTSTTPPFIISLENVCPGDYQKIRMVDNMGFEIKDYDGHLIKQPLDNYDLELVKTGSNTLFNYDTYVLTLNDGNMPYKFEWDHTDYLRYTKLSDNEVQIITTSDADWSVTITDASGCQEIIGATPTPTLHVVSVDIQPDNGEGTGLINLVVDGPSIYYNYYCYGPNEYENTLIKEDKEITLAGLYAGWYQISIEIEGGDMINEWVWVPYLKDSDIGNSGIRGKREASDNLLLKAMPNPFSEETAIKMGLAEDDDIRLSVYAIDGKLVKHLYTGKLKSGEVHTINFNAGHFSEGIYILKMTTGKGFLAHKKLFITK